MRYTILIILAMLCSAVVQGQSTVESVLAAVESNNPTLKALREQTEAQKLANRSGISLANPEVEYAHLWGSPSGIGARNDINVSQEFDLGTVLGIKRRLALSQNNLAELNFSIERTAILLKAKELCYDIIYYNAMFEESSRRLADATATACAYDKLIDQGRANIIDSNKAKINLATAEAETERIESERNAAINELRRLGAGDNFELSVTTVDMPTLPADFESWFEQASKRSPELLYATGAIESADKGITAAKAGSLPTLSAGYMREKVVGEGYQGIKVGVSVPLWQNRNNVKRARAEMRAAQSLRADTEQQLYTQLRSLYIKSAALYSTAKRYNTSEALRTAPTLLRKAFDEGQLSMLDYFAELSYFYTAKDDMLTATRDYMKSLARLEAFNL